MRDSNLQVWFDLPESATAAVVTVHITVAGKPYAIVLSHERNDRFSAGLLQEAIYSAITGRIEKVRAEEYERGYRAGRGRETRLLGGAGFVPWTVNWKPTHVLLWEKHRGKIPPGHALRFINGKRDDIRLDNLALLSRRELMARNTIHNLPKPLADTIQLLGALNRQIRRRTKSHEEQDRRSP